MATPGQSSASIAPEREADSGEQALSAENASQLRRLFEDHSDALRRYIAARFGPGPPEPEEVAQAAFAKVAGVRDIGAIGNLRGFLYTVACNIVIDHRRRAAHRNAVHDDLLLHFDGDSLSDLSAERVLLAKEQFAVFEAALNGMPAMRRRIFLMVRSEGQVPAAVARRFGITEGAVHKHISRALADCAKAFARADRQYGEQA